MGRNSDLGAVPSPQPPNFRRVDVPALSLSEFASDAPGGNPLGTKFFLSSAPNQWGDYDLWLKIADGIAQNPVTATQYSNPANQLNDSCINDDLHVYLWRN